MTALILVRNSRVGWFLGAGAFPVEEKGGEKERKGKTGASNRFHIVAPGSSFGLLLLVCGEPRDTKKKKKKKGGREVQPNLGFICLHAIRSAAIVVFLDRCARTLAGKKKKEEGEEGSREGRKDRLGPLLRYYTELELF